MSDPKIYTAQVHDEGRGSLWAEVVELPGCFASGDSLDELRVALAESIGLYLGDGSDRDGSDVHVDELRLHVSA